MVKEIHIIFIDENQELLDSQTLSIFPNFIKGQFIEIKHTINDLFGASLPKIKIKKNLIMEIRHRFETKTLGDTDYFLIVSVSLQIPLGS